MSATRPGGLILAAALAVLLLPCPAALAAAPAPADTVRTNLWLTEALMAEIVTAAASSLPPAPAALRLAPGDDEAATELMGTVAARTLGGLGYDLFAAQDDSSALAAVDAVFGFRVLSVDLDYPDVGRTLGLWRSWVGRDVTVAAMIVFYEADSGRILLQERLVRSFSDRVPDDSFADVNSNTYPFTSGQPGEGAWQRRVEQIVVLGALAGLVAIYFANTRD
jgi:hypothetical protein